MYNYHRGMGPAPGNPLNELLDCIRAAFESQARASGEYEHVCDAATSTAEVRRRRREENIKGFIYI